MWWMENQRVKLTWLWAVAAVLDLQDIDLAKEKGWKSNAKEGGGVISPNYSLSRHL